MSDPLDRLPGEKPLPPRLAGLARDATTASQSQLNDGWRRLALRRRPRRFLALAWLAPVALVVALVLVRVTSRPPATLTWTSHGVAREDSSWRALSGEDASISWSDGTHVALGRGARVGMRSLSPRAPALEILAGSARFDLPTRGTAWTIAAGPYRVTVLGTRFDLDWSPSKRLQVAVEQGHAVVTGPSIEGSRSLGAGDRLDIDLDKRPEPPVDTVIDPEPPAPPREEPRASAPPAKIAGAAPRAHLPESCRRPGWAHLLATGNARALLADAEARPLESCLEVAPLADLAALADAARYAARHDLARRTLVAERRRFPDSPLAHDAAFFLGRIEEAEHGPHAAALAWYERYLREAPRGSFAAEALGRQLVAAKRVRSPADVRALAAAYLARFPQGSYADLARGLANGR